MKILYEVMAELADALDLGSVTLARMFQRLSNIRVQRQIKELF